MPRPLKLREDLKQQTVWMRLDIETLSKLVSIAKDDCTYVSKLIERIVKNYLKGAEK